MLSRCVVPHASSPFTGSARMKLSSLRTRMLAAFLTRLAVVPIISKIGSTSHWQAALLSTVQLQLTESLARQDLLKRPLNLVDFFADDPN
jgi:hypothetical protein